MATKHINGEDRRCFDLQFPEYEPLLEMWDPQTPGEQAAKDGMRARLKERRYYAWCQLGYLAYYRKEWDELCGVVRRLKKQVLSLGGRL